MHVSILIIDDNAFIRQAIRRGFQGRNGFQVCGEAIDGRDGIAKARQLSPDLIILDFSMPVMNGLEAAVVLSCEMPSVPIIFFTMHTNSMLAQEALLAGVSAIVSKDRGPEALVSQAQTLLGLPSDR